MIIEKNAACTLSDGEVLRADVYRPDDEERHPVLMMRLPYDKETPRYFEEYLSVPRMVESGYVVILQDVRGRFASGGEFYPFVHEGKDGYDAVEWAARLPFSDGRVGMFGMSYHGYTQLAAASQHPPSLRAIAPVMTMADPWEGLLNDSDTVSATGKFETWVLGSMIEDHLKRKGTLDEEKLQHYLDNLPDYLYDFPADTWGPVQDLDPDSYFFEVMQRRVPSRVVKEADLRQTLQSATVPALFMGGWYDALLPSTLSAYRVYNGEKSFWIGPWTHEEMTGRAGEVFFEGAETEIGTELIKDTTELHIKWFDHWLKSKPSGVEDKVHLYITGSNKWRSFPSMPHGREAEIFFLKGSHELSAAEGGGGLGKEKDQQPLPHHMLLDPGAPVPTYGGSALVAGNESGMFDISGLQTRPDVLVYTSEPLKEKKLIMGEVEARLWGEAPSELFDAFIRLSEVDESGRAWNITETYHRERVVPREPAEMNLSVGVTAHEVKAGHRLRIDLSASNAPHYDVNLNNGQTTRTAVHGEKATEFIYSGPERASAIYLPVER
ncbi:CocE/NonD family hydrolase [Salimicrobium jeotgali]|uniref:CocE/NonD family hydrolase n=1 Tax=Salimicrobium jeotgali TaxID=1230341 RepID=UPI000C826069|nr:CocE/NonD family hydrolase [Salimicrobium jeotgali]